MPALGKVFLIFSSFSPKNKRLTHFTHFHTFLNVVFLSKQSEIQVSHYMYESINDHKCIPMRMIEPECEVRQMRSNAIYIHK
jgi:hypothetical protein